MVISKTLVKKNPNTNQEQVHIGMLSSQFIRDSGSEFVIAPIVSFNVVKKGESHDLEPLTIMPLKFINEILKYTCIFTSFEDFRLHILKDSFGKTGSFITGTEIFLCSLQYTFNSYENDIYLIDECKKKTDKTKDLNLHTQNTSVIDELLIEDIDHSLVTLVKYAYIDFPPNINLTVNSHMIDQQNPFGNIIQFVLENENLALKGMTTDYRYWIISDSKLEEYNIKQKFEGLLIYMGNEFIKKDEFSQPFAQMSLSVGQKRTHDQMLQKMDRLNGIIMIFCSSKSSELTYDRQDLVNNQFLQSIREDITRNYHEHNVPAKVILNEELMTEKKRQKKNDTILEPSQKDVKKIDAQTTVADEEQLMMQPHILP